MLVSALIAAPTSTEIGERHRHHLPGRISGRRTAFGDQDTGHGSDVSCLSMVQSARRRQSPLSVRLK